MWGQPPSAVRRALRGCFWEAEQNLESTARKAAIEALTRTETEYMSMKFKQNPILRRALHCAVLAAAVFAFSGASDPSTRFNELGHQLMCICSCGQILLECNHVGCPDSDGMRNELMAAVSRGDSDSLVQQAFVQKYGPTVLAAPTTTGFDRTAWIMPFVVLLAGIALVVYIVRSWKNKPAPALADGLTPARGADLDEFREQARKETDL
jgi:cytochrome c-type biogenesis protein CcmH/NrfF